MRAPKRKPAPVRWPNANRPSHYRAPRPSQGRANFSAPPNQTGLPKPKPKPKPAMKTAPPPRDVQQGQQPPGATSIPPPITVAGETMRNNAGVSYAAAQTAANQGLYNAALRYGDPSLLSRPEFASFLNGQDPNAISMENSELGSIMTQLRRNLDVADQENNAAGTLFSGFRNQDRDEENQEANKARQDAYDRYMAASQDWSTALAEAMYDYYGNLDQANMTDLEAFLATDPEALGGRGGQGSGSPAAPGAAPTGAAAQHAHAQSQGQAQSAHAQAVARAKAAAKAKLKPAAARHDQAQSQGNAQAEHDSQTSQAKRKPKRKGGK